MSTFNEQVTAFIESYYKPLDEKLDELRKENEEKGIPIILKETESFLSLILSLIRPGQILEIGTAYGYSALFFARSLPESKITTIERSQKMIQVASANFENFQGGERIDFRTGDATEILDQMIQENAIKTSPCFYDFVFIDAGKSHYKEFFDKAEKLCNPGAIIVCDNILMHGWIVDSSFEGFKRHRTNIKYMKKFIEYIKERADLTVSLLSSGDGLAIIRLNNERKD
ncbi:MAG TPA: O-methyltransferase [Mogibacterium sp.]|nr:O-methyltransferase [Mogibacterium sp.]